MQAYFATVGREWEGSISTGPAKRDDCCHILFRVAHNRRLLEFLVNDGNDCRRVDDDRPNEAGDIQRMSDAS